MRTRKKPDCPKCGRKKLPKQMSGFAMTGKKGGDGEDELPFDESKMESAVNSLAAEAESINEDDPRQAAQFMRKFTEKTGMELGDTMNEAIARMEKGEDPDQIEQELGDSIENEDPFKLPGKTVRTVKAASRKIHARRDPNIYDL